MVSDREDEVDQALSKLGRYSSWQLVMYGLICISFNLSGTWHMLSIVFTGLLIISSPENYYVL